MSYGQRGGRGGGIEPPLPKPYEFVPLPSRVQRQQPAGHQGYQQLSGTLRAVLVAYSPLHVASGLMELNDNKKYPLVKAHFRVGKHPAIPGSSLKGCIRSIVEAISPSAVGVSRARLPREMQVSRSINELDPAQRLFGAMSYQGQVCFSDALLDGGKTEIVATPPLYRPRAESHDTYFDGSRPRGRKFYMHGQLAEGNVPLETCPVWSRFPFRVDFVNLAAAELGLLLYGLGLGDPRLWPKLGGSKPSCLGTVEVVEPRLEVLDSRAAGTDFDTAPEAVEDINSYLEAARAEKLVLDEQLRRLAEIVRWPREDRACPDRNY
jgi:hypothetical protein